MNYILLIFTFLLVNSPSETNTLTLTISNINNIEGNLRIGLFNTGESFLEEGQAYRSFNVEVNDESETIVIKNLPKGNYAIGLYHDKNSNDKCDRNFLGIPKEPYAFSNNFKPRFSAPTFKDCQFEISSDHKLELKLID